MDSLYKGITTLLRSALNGEALTLPEDFDWNKAADLLYNHHLTGLGIQGATLCGVPRTHPAVVHMTALFCQTLQTTRLQMQKLNEVFALFEANGIDYLPVKGSVIKPLYPKMEYRIMGDADILIRPEQYPQIQSLLPSLGLQKTESTDCDDTWECPSLTLELHHSLFSKHYLNYFEYYKNSWQYARKCDHSFGYRLTPEAHYVYLFVHFAKHYLVGSICAKDLCDFYVWRQAHPNMDEEYIQKQLKILHLIDFYYNILSLLDNWFNDAPATEASELITRSAFQGGVYTEYNQSAATNMMQRHSTETDSLTKKKFKWFLHTIFPSCDALSSTYPLLEKYRFLLPVFWLVRWFNTIFRDRDGIKRGLVVMKIDKSNLTEYETHMNTIGLGGCIQR